ncbi:hypothetical protein NEFER02_0268 [Nematocida sp. LUAm2]|nr:hypothetical protein NEFER02_0268 [Nematocida sp. LUAm2]
MKAVNRSSNAHSDIEMVQEDKSFTFHHENIDPNSKNMDYSYIICFISIVVLDALNIYRTVWPYTSIYINNEKNYIEKLIKYAIIIENACLAISFTTCLTYACLSLSKKRSATIKHIMVFFIVIILCECSVSLILFLVYAQIIHQSVFNVLIFYFDKIVDIVIISICAPIVFIYFLNEYKKKPSYNNKKIFSIIIISIVLLAFIYAEHIHFVYIGIKRFLAYRNGDPNYAKIV